MQGIKFETAGSYTNIHRGYTTAEDLISDIKERHDNKLSYERIGNYSYKKVQPNDISCIKELISKHGDFPYY